VSCGRSCTTSSISVRFVFLILGASLPLHAMGEHLLGGLAVVAALVLVARPLTVLVCLMPDRRARWTRRELVFLAATRETGVMPAALASIVAAWASPPPT
jgi:potassium/hydrogen antiporter